MKDEGIDVTLRNNPEHVLAPDNSDIIRDFKFDKIEPEEFKVYYHKLLKDRWVSRKDEFMSLVKLGKSKEVKLKCTCSKCVEECHANIAANFLNKLIATLLK